MRRPSAHVAFKISDEAEWYTSNMAPGTSECGWVFNKTAYDALPPQYQDFLMGQREMVMTMTQEAYAAQDKENLPAFEKSMTKITYTSIPQLDGEFKAPNLLVRRCMRSFGHGSIAGPFSHASRARDA
jgi:TRAP-type C4-dicarboxylate transport system substrate-binding protein